MAEVLTFEELLARLTPEQRSAIQAARDEWVASTNRLIVQMTAEVAAGQRRRRAWRVLLAIVLTAIAATPLTVLFDQFLFTKFVAAAWIFEVPLSVAQLIPAAIKLVIVAITLLAVEWLLGVFLARRDRRAEFDAAICSDKAKTSRRPTSPEFESVAQITIDLCRSGKSFIRGTLLGRPNAGGPYVDDASVPKEVLRLLTELREEYAVARPNDELMQKGRK